MLALMEGRFERAEQLISETLALGERAESWNALVSQRLALFVLRHAQGRLAELVDAITRSVHEYPTLLRFSCALVHVYGELDRERDCRAAFDPLLSRDLGNEYVDAEWLFSMSLLADPVHVPRGPGRGGQAVRAATPVRAALCPGTRRSGFWLAGASAGRPGLHARQLRPRRAALRLRHRDGAEDGWAALVRPCPTRPGWHALTRDATGDRERAHALLDEALGTYRELRMETWPCVR